MNRRGGGKQAGPPRIRFEGVEAVDAGGVGRRGVEIEGGRFVSVSRRDAVVVDGEGCYIFPPPVNAHDHMLGTWSPPFVPRRYRNVYEWLNDLHTADNPLLTERAKVPVHTVYTIGAYRNIFGASATVVDHYMRDVEADRDGLPVRVVHDFGRTWTLRHPTGWGMDVAGELAYAGDSRPYVIHLGEGVDEEVAGELGLLESMGGLRRNTLLVHGVIFDESDLGKVAAAGASIAWCPVSNVRLYGRTLDVEAALRCGVNVCVGTDSALTGGDNMLEEMRFARNVCGGVSAETLFRMVTVNAARALLMEDAIGRLEAGLSADVLMVRKEGADPFDAYLSVRSSCVDLLMLGGVPLLGSVRHEDLFVACRGAFSRVLVDGEPMLVRGDPVGLMEEVERLLGYRKEFHFLPVIERC